MPGRGCSDIKLSSGWDAAGGDSQSRFIAQKPTSLPPGIPGHRPNTFLGKQLVLNKYLLN